MPETNNDQEITPGKPENDNQAPTAQKKADPVKRWATLVLILALSFFVLHILFDKFTPYSSYGRVKAFIVPIVPLVSGPLTEVNVINNQHVTAGQVLAVIDAEKYELAVRKARADLQLATQSTQAEVAAVSAAQAKVAEARANLQNAEIKGDRIIRLSKKGAASMSRADDARSKIASSKARLARAQAELEKAKYNLGKAGQDNARVRAAMVALESAELDLYRSSIRAPSDGIITNLTVDVGQYAGAGTPIMTFISTGFIWIQADMRENCLVHIDPGDRVDMVLDAAPGRIFKGKVMSIGYGVSDNSSSAPGSLATVQVSQGWLRQAQYLPVLISFTDIERARGSLRAGGQVNVTVYTGEHPLLNPIAWFWIRLVSVLSHIY